MKGTIFGGFTPVEWELWKLNGNTSDLHTADPSLKSFLFTFKNSYNIPARRFALKVEEKDKAIIYYSDDGPRFNDTLKNSYNIRPRRFAAV
jgi:hypothetical protein